jgi:hypothetical protein
MTALCIAYLHANYTDIEHSAAKVYTVMHAVMYAHVLQSRYQQL